MTLLSMPRQALILRGLPQGDRAPNGRILVVDDEALVRSLLVTFLSGEGFEAIAAADAFEAIEQIEVRHFDLILMDLHMPGMDGEELLMALLDQGVSIPIIIVSGCVDTEAIPSDCVYAVLKKPARMQDLVVKVREALCVC